VPPRILIVGAGAIGSIYAARLSRVADVVAYDTRADHVEAINHSGLRLTWDGGEMVARIRAASDPSELGDRFDFAILAVKAPQTRDAVRAARAALAGAVSLSVQNGIGNEEILAEETDAAVSQGVCMHAGEIVGPGHAIHHYDHDTWIGPFRCTLQQAESLGALMNQAGLKTHVLEDPRGAIWSKLIFQATFAPLSVLVGGIQTNIFEDPHVSALAKGVIEEGKRVAETMGIKLLFDPMEMMAQARKGGGGHRGSMQHDIERRQSTEIEVTTGAIVRKAKEIKVDTPRLETFYRLIKGMEFNFGIG
jgi:2-dehydropantoate 2-reductase